MAELPLPVSDSTGKGLGDGQASCPGLCAEGDENVRD